VHHGQVVLQRRQGAGWTDVRRAKESADGHYVLRIHMEPRDLGRYRARVRARPSSTYRPGLSRTVTVHVTR
jgi:hypothetical protein